MARADVTAGTLCDTRGVTAHRIVRKAVSLPCDRCDTLSRDTYYYFSRFGPPQGEGSQHTSLALAGVTSVTLVSSAFVITTSSFRPVGHVRHYDQFDSDRYQCLRHRRRGGLL